MLDAQHLTDLESRLNDFDISHRNAALEELAAAAAAGDVDLPPQGTNANIHMHSFLSYNAVGHSPSRLAWEARKAGLFAAGNVEFDVLDGMDEFLAATDLLCLRATVGVESRVFVGDYADKEINSPGEPGIMYQMGIGFYKKPLRGSDAEAVLDSMRSLARDRNEKMAARINAHLVEAAIDYERDVLPLAPSGNATERHMLSAYETRAEAAFADVEKRAAYWSTKLGMQQNELQPMLADGPKFRDLLRAKLMKRGGVGYASPERGSFPSLEQMNEMSAACDAMPCVTWLDGTSAGEASSDEVVEYHASKGALAINIIPDRNWNLKDPELAKLKREKLHAIVASAQRAGLVIIHGTELNKLGQPFVDDLDCEALAPVAEPLREGVYAAYGHTAMARFMERPMGGDWASSTFGDDAGARSRFYSEVGRLLEPGVAARDRLCAACDADDPAGILSALRG